MIQGLNRKELHSSAVLQAMQRVPREEFVPDAYRNLAQSDRALPIGSRQTISQPFIVAFMSQEAKIKPGDKVLEIGTGSGYQTAVLAELGAEVYSLEIIAELADSARTLLTRLGYGQVHLRQDDGWKGWKEQAPYDAILVTAAAPRIPPELFAQLAEAGSLIIPLVFEEQGREVLCLVRKNDGAMKIRELLDVRFVPLTGGSSDPSPEQ